MSWLCVRYKNEEQTSEDKEWILERCGHVNNSNEHFLTDLSPEMFSYSHVSGNNFLICIFPFVLVALRVFKVIILVGPLHQT